MTTTTTTAAPLPCNSLSYVPGRIQVFVNCNQLLPNQYIATDGLTITLVTPALPGDIVSIATFDIIPVSNPSDFYYVFLGRTQTWGGTDSPPIPVDTRVADAETKRNILAVKRIEPIDVVLMIPRINWTSGTKYVSYHDDVPIQGTAFYVLNTSNRIYKCIFSPNTPSITEPSHTSSGPMIVEDGYIWELIYEVPVADQLKFLTSDFIPVRFYSTSSTFDHTGLLDYITVVNAGTGYVTPPLINILGDGNGALATAEISGGAVTRINVTDGGEGYSFAMVQIIGGGGNATAEAVLRASDLPNTINQNAASYAISTAGAINNIEIISPGMGYQNGRTTATVVGDGVGVEVSPPIISTDGQGRILGIDILQRGHNYTFATVEIASIDATTFAIAKVVIEPQGGHGSNIPQELFATVVGITVSIEDVMTDFFTNNNFRQLGIITNITKYKDFGLFSDDTGNACYVATVSDISFYAIDDVLTTDDGGKFIVADIDGLTLFLLPVIDAISLSSTLTNTSSGWSPLFLSTLIAPEISTKSGNIIYLSNITPVTREPGQAEQLKLYFSF